MTQQINLLEPALRPMRRWGRDMLLAGAALAAAVLLHHQFERMALARVLAASGAAPGEATAAVDTELQERQARLQRDDLLLKTVAGLIDLPHDSARRLRVLIAALPPDAWLTEVEFSGARGVRIAGGALDALSVAEFARRLGREPAFKGLPVQVFALDARAAETAASAPSTTASTTASTPAEAPEGRLPAFHAFVFSSPDAVARESR